MENQDKDDDIVEVLVKAELIHPDELRALPELRDCLSNPQAALRLAAGARQRFGELLTDVQCLVEEQLARALDEQSRTREKLGEVLIRLGYLSLEEREIVLAFQQRQAGDVAASDTLRLGHILVATGEISDSQLSIALERKRETGLRIGEELIAEGHLSNERLDRALKLQRRLLMAAFVAALSPVSPATVKHAKAAQTRVFMSVSATVVDSVSIRAVHQAQDLVITAQDIQRGYVEVPGGSRFEIRNKGPCAFEFRPVGDLFRSATISGLGGPAQLGATGGTVLQNATGNALARVDISYRFDLAPGVSPGAYKWPLALTVLPM